MNNAAGDVPIPAVDPQPGHENGAAVGMKLLVDLDEAGRPHGDNYAKLATLVGKLVRAQVPLNYTDWRIVPQIFKDSIWEGLMMKFTFAVPSSLVRPTVEGSYSQKFRKFKYRLRKSLKGKVTAEDILSVKPPGCHLPFWEAFVENESKPESSAKRAKYKENCEKNTVRHTLGRLSYAQKMYNLQLNDEDFIAGRPEIWMEGHKGKNGVIHPSAIEKFEQVKIANEKRKSLSKDGYLSAMDFENDAITDVFGPDKGKGCFRAFSSQLSKSQAITARLAKTVNASKASSSAGSKENSVLVDRINKLSKAFDDFVAIQQLNQLQSNSVPSVDASSPTKVGSTSSAVDAMGNQESNNGRTQYVNLLNKKKKIAATGYIMQGKEGRVFHGQPLAADERRVQIEAILDETCDVYDAPQGDDYFTLKDLLGITGWLVWPLKRLEFLDE